MPNFGIKPKANAPLVFVVSTPATTWGPFVHNQGFIPTSIKAIVNKQGGGTEELIGEEIVTETEVTVLFSNPQTGTLLVSRG